VSASRSCTLLVLDGRARLLDGAGGLLAELPAAAPEQDDRAETLRRALPARARVQLVLAGPGLEFQCTEAPALAARERGAVLQRWLRTADRPEAPCAAHTLDPDPLAEGGHVLWLASCPRRELDPWLGLLRAAGARPVFATLWQRAVLEAARQTHPSALYLALEPGLARLLFFRGRSLRFSRAFPLPPALDPGALDPAGGQELARVVAEALALALQFIQQKHRGAPPTELCCIGLPAGPVHVLEPAARSLGLTLGNLAPELGPFLAQGADRERRRKGRLDLIPAEVREARSRAVFRAVVRAALAGMLLLGAGAKVVLLRHEATLEQEAARAEAALERRQSLAREGEAAARLRFGLLRVRWAEARQRRAMEQLERLGVRIFQATRGVELRKVDITQEPGDGLLLRFKVEGDARTGPGFSLGALAGYFNRLAELPGLKLEPLRDVTVRDGGEQGAPDPALTRFTLEGTAP
jgi:hypothetical protein